MIRFRGFRWEFPWMVHKGNDWKVYRSLWAALKGQFAWNARQTQGGESK